MFPLFKKYIYILIQVCLFVLLKNHVRFVVVDVYEEKTTSTIETHIYLPKTSVRVQIYIYYICLNDQNNKSI